MSIKELLSEQIAWLDYINPILVPYHVLTEKEQVIVLVPDYFSKLIDLLAKTPRGHYYFHLR